MKKVVVTALCITFLVLFVCFFLLIDQPHQTPVTSVATDPETTATTSGPDPAPTEPTQSAEEKSVPLAETGADETLTIDITSLSDSQRAILETLGVSGDTLMITPDARVCAEEKLSEARLLEIVDGATPSFSESLSLINCYRNN